jgi:hypothetical protein
MASLGGMAATGAPHSDSIKAVQGYINKILKPKDASRAVDGMKALLLDRETKTIVSMVYSMHEILSKEGACQRPAAAGWRAGGTAAGQPSCGVPKVSRRRRRRHPPPQLTLPHPPPPSRPPHPAPAQCTWWRRSRRRTTT